jgi:hypothetical protein
VQIDQSGRREAGGVIRESFLEAPLVMIESVSGRIVFSADVDDGMAGC